MATGRKRRLGRGLDGLLPPSPTRDGKGGGDSPLREVPPEHLTPNPGQPRRRFE